MAQVPDPDDILRQIDVNNVAECATHTGSLWLNLYQNLGNIVLAKI